MYYGYILLLPPNLPRSLIPKHTKKHNSSSSNSNNKNNGELPKNMESILCWPLFQIIQPAWGMVDIHSATRLNKTDYPSLRSYQLQLTSWLGGGTLFPLPLLCAGILSDLNFKRRLQVVADSKETASSRHNRSWCTYELMATVTAFARPVLKKYQQEPRKPWLQKPAQVIDLSHAGFLSLVPSSQCSYFSKHSIHPVVLLTNVRHKEKNYKYLWL